MSATEMQTGVRYVVLKRLVRTGGGRPALDDRVLALNLSYVLHDRSKSTAVRSAIRAIRNHANAILSINASFATPVNAGDINTADVTRWLTATLGIPHQLAGALHVPQNRVVAVDAAGGPMQPIELFRATANAILPSETPERVGVAALILRPDRRTPQLVVAGVHDWPDDRLGAIRSLERLVQAHAGQWMPSRPLWPAPAESLVPDEVY